MPASAVCSTREAVRFEFKEALMVTITLDDDRREEMPESLPACLLNLSPHGAKLVVPKPLPLGRNFRLRLTIEQFAMEFYVGAKVCWTASEGESGSVMGCQFKPGIPDKLLAHFAADGNLDRRSSDREKTKWTLGMARQGTKGRGKEKVTLQNYSTGGFCMEANSALALGERFRLTSDRRDWNVEAVVHWQLKKSGMYLHGCGYAEESGCETLEQAISLADEPLMSSPTLNTCS